MAPQTDEQSSRVPRKRVLLLTHRFPYPPNRGDRIRSYNLMRVLAESFDVTLACPHDEPVTGDQHAHVDEICEHVITSPVGATRWIRAGQSFLFGHSLTEGLFHSSDLSNQIGSLHQRMPFDCAFVFCSSMFPYVDTPEFADTPIVTDLVDVDSEKWRQMSEESAVPKSWIYSAETKRIRSLEKRIADRSSAVVLVSDSEAELFRSVVKTNTPVIGVSNGVDTDYFRPSDSISNPTDESRSLKSEGRSVKREPSSSFPLPTSNFQLLFTGVLDYPPNVEGMRWFCNDIVPELRKRVAFQLDIVGRRPCAIVKQLDRIDGVTVVGEVPDVRPYLHRADAAISPLRLARGIQNKVLEAMACGLPVVATTQSAEGIDATPGEELLIADEIETWVNAIADLQSDANRRRMIGRSARELVEVRYGWDARLSRVNEVVAAC